MARKSRKPKHVNMESYWDNRSKKFLFRYDEELKKVRVETSEERKERLLSLPHTHRGYVGTETYLLAEEANQENLKAPVTTRFVGIKKVEEDHELEETMTEDMIVFNEMNQTAKWHEIWEKHPLWLEADNISTNTWLDDDDTTPITLDRFGFHDSLLSPIRTLWANKLSGTGTRNPNEDERVLLASQVTLSACLKVTNGKQKASVLHMIRRLNLSMVDDEIEYVTNTGSKLDAITTNMGKLADKIASNVGTYYKNFSIKPGDVRTARPRLTMDEAKMDSNDRLNMLMDWKLLQSYGFTREEAAEIASKLNGQVRSDRTMAEWGLDGEPKKKVTSWQGPRENQQQENKIQESEPMTTNSSQESTVTGSNQASEEVKNAATQILEGMIGVAKESDGGVLGVSYQEVRDEVIDDVKEALDDFKKEFSSGFQLGYDEGKDLARQQRGTETTELQRELNRMKGDVSQEGSLSYWKNEARVNEQGRNESDKKLRTANEQIASLTKELNEAKVLLEEEKRLNQSRSMGNSAAQLQNQLLTQLKQTGS